MRGLYFPEGFGDGHHPWVEGGIVRFCHCVLYFFIHLLRLEVAFEAEFGLDLILRLQLVIGLVDQKLEVQFIGLPIDYILGVGDQWVFAPLHPLEVAGTSALS